MLPVTTEIMPEPPLKPHPAMDMPATYHSCLGINAEDKTEAIAVLSQKETPGLGANMTGKKFKSNFVQKDIKATKWSVKKDGGDIDQITAATISSRAVSGAVKDAIAAYLANIDKIKQTGK